VAHFFAVNNAFLWCGASSGQLVSVDFWSGAWFSVAPHIDALNFLVDAVAGGTRVGSSINFITFRVPFTVDVSTVTLFLFNAFGSFRVEDETFFTSTTFNTSVSAFRVPLWHVSASLWTSGDAWRVSGASVALHWAEMVAPPVNVNSESVTLVGVSGDGGTETGAVSSGVTGTGIENTVFKVFFWVDVLMARSENTGIIGEDGASLGGPWFSVVVGVTRVDHGDSSWAGFVSRPRISESEDVSGGDSTSGD
jgi:hypothetical protein